MTPEDKMKYANLKENWHCKIFVCLIGKKDEITSNLRKRNEILQSKKFKVDRSMNFLTKYDQ